MLKKIYFILQNCLGYTNTGDVGVPVLGWLFASWCVL